MNPNGNAPELTPRGTRRPSSEAIPTAAPPAPRSRAFLAAGIVVGLVVVVALGAAVVTALRAKEAPAPPPAPAAAPVAVAEPPPAPEPPGVPFTDTEIAFGMAAPFSGATKELGRGIKTGVELAFAAANEGGGVHGRKLRLVALDDGYEPARTVEVMRDLVERRKVFAVVGNVGSVTAAVSVPYVLDQKVLLLGALSGAPVLRRDPPDRYVFNFRPSYAEETAAAVRYLVQVRRYKPSQVAFFAQEDDFGEAGWTGVAQQMRRFGRDPATVLRVGYRRNSAEVDEAIARIRAAADRVKAVVMVATYRGAAHFVQKVRDAGLGLTFTDVSAVDADALADELLEAGARYTQDVVVTQVVPLPTSSAPGVARYRELLAANALGARPGFLSLEGYVVGSILVEGLRRAGKALSTEALVDALEGMRGVDLGIGVPVSYGESEHQASHKVWGSVLQPDGTYRPIELE